MRYGIPLALAAVCSTTLAGCYRSHGRTEDADLDGAVADASMDAALDARTDGADASPLRCRVRCGAPELVATREMHELLGLLDVAWNGRSLGVLALHYYYGGADVHPEYALVLVDPLAGTIRVGDTADAVRTTQQLVGGGLHARERAWIATVLRTDAIGPFLPIVATVGAALWDADGGLLGQYATLATLPETLVSCDCPHVAAAFGRGATSIAAIAQGDAVWAARLQWDIEPPAADVRRLAALPLDVPGSTPLEGGLLSGDSVVLAGGGFGRGLERRDAFVVEGSFDAAPLVSMPGPGAAFDPPPRVVVARDGTHFYVFRRVSNTTDLGASDLRAQVWSASGALLGELSLPLRDGLVPLEIAPYATAGGAGLVWVDRSGDVHMLPAVDVDTMRECGPDIDAPPVATLPRGLDTAPSYQGGRALLTTTDERGVLLVVLEPDQVLTVLRVPECEVIAGP